MSSESPENPPNVMHNTKSSTVAASAAVHDAAAEAAWALEFIRDIIRRCPERMPTSEDERRAHEIIGEQMRAQGLDVERHGFRWNSDLYATLALHFGLGASASLLSRKAPLLAAAIHAFSAISYASDSAQRSLLLRRVFPFRESQNMIGVLPATGEPRLRIVYVAHTDAAYTGKVFDPSFVRRFGKPGKGPLAKPLRLAVLSLLALSLLDLLELRRSPSSVRTLIRALLTLPPAISAALNFDVVLRNQIVPGAADDLSGVAGILLLARRLMVKKPDDVELVFVASGCEEAGLGGSRAMAKEFQGRWDRDKTYVIGLDGGANGDLFWFEEGEIFPAPLDPGLRGHLEHIAANDDRFRTVTPFAIPVGGTDAIPFARAGYKAVTVGCVDRELHMPRHYHYPTDTPENLEADAIPRSVDYLEVLTERLWAVPS